MLVNLDKSLQMVEEAKKSKAIRLRCSQRLKELYAEMQTVKHAVKQEELKLARIQPEIQASHEIIISLKQKRHKLYTAAMDLGRGLRGADYRYYHHQPQQQPERRGKAGTKRLQKSHQKKGIGKFYAIISLFSLQVTRRGQGGHNQQIYTTHQRDTSLQFHSEVRRPQKVD